MAAKKNVENVTVNTEEVVEDAVTTEIPAEPETSEETTVTEEPEKKVGFIGAIVEAQKAEFKEAPVKYIGKKALKLAIVCLAIKGGKEVFKSLTSDVADEVVEAGTEALTDAVVDVVTEQ